MRLIGLECSALARVCSALANSSFLIVVRRSAVMPRCGSLRPRSDVCQEGGTTGEDSSEVHRCLRACRRKVGGRGKKGA